MSRDYRMTEKKRSKKPKSKHIKCPFCGREFNARRKKQKFFNRMKRREGVNSWQVKGVIYGKNKVRCPSCGKTITFGRDIYFKEKKGHKNII